MPKRKSASGSGSSDQSIAITSPSLSSLDAALDLLACDTFGRLAALTAKFESAAGVKLNDGVVKHRWEEAVKRYWVMKSMDDLSCDASSKRANGEADSQGEVAMTDETVANGHDRDDGHYDRPMPSDHHPGAVMAFQLDGDEEVQWRRWSPRLHDLVLVDLPSEGVWPGKIIDKRTFFQGRNTPRGNHFFPVRIYGEHIPNTVVVKGRMIPFTLRPSPPLLASEALLSAYNHAANPISFDAIASNRESAEAYARSHPGVTDEAGLAEIKEEKERWKKFVNWLMNERRVEKLRALYEERERRLKAVTKSDATTQLEDTGAAEDDDCSNPRKRRVKATMPPFSYKSTKKTVEKVDNGDGNDRGGIFRVTALSPTPTPSSSRSSTPMASYIRPALAAPYHRAASPRRTDRRRNGIFTGVGEFSPRARGGTYTPPRVLPSGDETAPYASPSPAPSLRNFDFVSPLGPVKFGKLAGDIDDDVVMSVKNGSAGTSLEVVKEEAEEEGTWTVVKTRSKRAGSAPAPPGQVKDEAALVNGSRDDIGL